MRIPREVVKLFEKTMVMYIYAETPLHPGSGTAISGIADLPVQRERHTGFPIIQGSSLKGVMRSSAESVGIEGAVKLKRGEEEIEKKKVDIVFGEPERIGGVSVTDARLLAFPVRTLKGVFGWITCPLVLDRYKRDLTLAGFEANWDVPGPSSEEKVLVKENSNLVLEAREGDTTRKYVYLEDLQLEIEQKEISDKIFEGIFAALPENKEYKALKEKLKKDLIIVSDEVFRELVLLTTEIIARIRIKPETGTVQGGALWYEEYLPTDTLMYSLILIPRRLDTLTSEETADMLLQYNGAIIQIGGDETIGKGFARIKVLGGKNAKKP
ncbi:MAG: type III-B CRISPR module RAMP protein Cmr4 [Candidatus Freyarchaeota archaeon]